MPNPNRTRWPLKRAAIAFAMAGLAAPAFGQAVEGLTVTGHYGDGGRSISTAVPYDDLDLTTIYGRDTLKDRVHAAARDLCSRLGESNTSIAGEPTCERDALTSARASVHDAIAASRMPDYAYLPPEDPYVAPAGSAAASAGSYGASASTVTSDPAYAPTYTHRTITNGPVGDTPDTRNRYGGPMSDGGRSTTPAGN